MDENLQELVIDLIKEGQPCLREWNGDGYNYRCWYCFAPTEVSTNYPFAVSDHTEDCPWFQLYQHYKQSVGQQI